MSVQQYKNLPNLAKEVLEELLSVSADIQASWSDARRAHYEQFCNDITGEGSTDMGWSIEERVDTPRDLQFLVERVGSILGEINNHGCPPSNWTEDENEAFKLLASRIPQPSEQILLKSEIEDAVKKMSKGKITRRAFIGNFASYTINESESFVFCLPHQHNCHERHPCEGRDFFIFKYTKESRSKGLWAKVKQAFLSRR